MNWSNVKLILAREIRDQLRDRRTLFMIFVLPMLLYPLLGMTLFQATQFMREQSSRILVLGAARLSGRDDLPPLFDTKDPNRFDGRLFSEPGKARLLELHLGPVEPKNTAPDVAPLTADPSPARGEGRREASSHPYAPGTRPREAACEAIQAGDFDAAVCFPPDFVDRLGVFRRKIENRDATSPLDVRPEVLHSSAKERSQIAFARLHEVLGRWTEEIGKKNLAAVGIPAEAARPFDVMSADVADSTGFRGAAIWSKILPVLLLVWALTGAFYPAVDLCAGEKERGTLETLLCSPAERIEIVLGKLGTIMLFSVVTAALNLVSMGITGSLVLTQVPQFGPPPAMSIVWLPMALIPMSALFSALCLALAALARSTKEGQYYLMPLLLITMPLVLMPVAPGVELNLGNSLIPITGVVLLLRAALEGNYLLALQYLPPVAAVTLGGCLLAIRWAVEQFNSESVLFRESERLDVTLWLRHLVADRRPTPSVAEAVFCGLLILLLRFFLSFTVSPPQGFHDFMVQTVTIQLAVVVAPALLMAVMLTRSAQSTFLLHRPSWPTLPAAVMLAILLHPAVRALGIAVTYLYPLNEKVMEWGRQIESLTSAVPLWQVILLMAVLPAVCEELAFRGFILSGFRHLGHKWRAIVYASLFFAVSHFILQQSITTFLVGLVAGYVAVQSGSIWPAMLFHVTHNSLAMASARWAPRLLEQWPSLRYVFGAPEADNLAWQWPVVLATAVLALVVLAWFHRLPYPRSEEEINQEALAGAVPTEG